MPFKVGDNVVVVKDNLIKPVPINYKGYLDGIFTIKRIVNSTSFPYECSVEGTDTIFAFREKEIELANKKLAQIKRESKEF